MRKERKFSKKEGQKETVKMKKKELKFSKEERQ